jgi:hypothetical protein
MVHTKVVGGYCACRYAVYRLLAAAAPFFLAASVLPFLSSRFAVFGSAKARMDHSSPPRLLRIVAAALLSLVFAYVAAAANCDVQPLVIPLRKQNGSEAFGVDLQLDDQEFQLPVSIVGNATIVASVEACRDYYNSYGFETVDACLEIFGVALENSDDDSGDTGVEKMDAKLSGGHIDVKDYSVVVLRQKSPQYNITGIGLVCLQ